MFIPVWVILVIGLTVTLISLSIMYMLSIKIPKMFEEQNKHAKEVANKAYYDNVKLLKEEIDKVASNAENLEDTTYWLGFLEAIKLLRKAVDAL